MKLIDHCPLDPACLSKKLYQTDKGELLRVDAKTLELVPHLCNTKGKSEAPDLIYVGEYENERNGRTRYTPPTKLLRSALRPPHDESTRKNGKNVSDWRLKKVWVTKTAWEEVTDIPPQ